MSVTSSADQKGADVPELIPARMLNEFCYCPRLAYLEWVQGEFADNLETRQGRFAHRRVDRPDHRPLPEANAPSSEKEGDSPILPTGKSGQSPGCPPAADRQDGDRDADQDATPAGGDASRPETIHSRSTMLSAPGEGLIAKIDLIDLSAGNAVPVDYKRGKVPDVPGGAWEPEQVQLCAQGLILRENGYHCEGGFLYFVASRRRVSVPFEEPLVKRTRELIGQMRAMAAGGWIPPPLEDSPKCPRCSLVGICLPDETRLLAGGGEPAAKDNVRRLMPARDEALPLYVQHQGTTLGKSGDQLTVSRRGDTLRKIKLIDVSSVCLFGNVQVTAQALREITAAELPLCHFSYGGWFHAVTRGMAQKNVELRIAQFAAAADPPQALRLARRLVAAKIKNCRTLLRRHLKTSDRDLLARLARLVKRAGRAHSAETLLGIEGTAAKEYFAGLARLFRSDLPFRFDNRNRRPPRDPINALLSFVYAILLKEWTVALYAVGFDPMLGFYHRPRYGRPSLALDLAEPFRPLVADSAVLMAVNNGEVNPDQFIHRAGAVALTDPGRRAIIAAFERRMDTLVRHPVFGYRISYRRVFEVQARLLARTLSGEIAEYPDFCTR